MINWNNLQLLHVSCGWPLQKETKKKKKEKKKTEKGAYKFSDDESLDSVAFFCLFWHVLFSLFMNKIFVYYTSCFDNHIRYDSIA